MPSRTRRLYCNNSSCVHPYHRQCLFRHWKPWAKVKHTDPVFKWRNHHRIVAVLASEQLHPLFGCICPPTNNHHPRESCGQLATLSPLITINDSIGKRTHVCFSYQFILGPSALCSWKTKLKQGKKERKDKNSNEQFTFLSWFLACQRILL